MSAATGLALLAVGLAATTAAADTGPAVAAVLSTKDATLQLAPQPGSRFDSATPAAAKDITVDAAQRFQQMDGFGASMTDSSASLISALPPAQRDEVMRRLFDRERGIGLSYLRQPIGSSDFVDGDHYTYNDIPVDQTDYEMERFSIDRDRERIIPLLRQAIALNPEIKVMGTPWGQPAWMKEGGVLEKGQRFGGTLKDDPKVIEAYARYLVRFVQEYERAGVPIDALTVQNEPQNGKPDGYPVTAMSPEMQAKVINALGPMLQRAGLSRVKIVAFDHNWAVFPGDPGPADYAAQVLRSSAASWTAGAAYHCYAGEPSAQTTLHQEFPDKGIWFTECSPFRSTGDSQELSYSGTLWFHSHWLSVGATRNWARTVVGWNLALDSQGGPVNGGCGNSADGHCVGTVTIDGTDVRYEANYVTLGHLSKFVRPGAYRIGSTGANSLDHVAFRNPDGSTALVVHDPDGGAETFTVTVDGRRVQYSMPEGGLMTLTWGGSGDSAVPAAPSPQPTTPTAPAKPTAVPSSSPAPTTTAPEIGDDGAPVIDPDRWYQIEHRGTGQCVDLVDTRRRLQQADCTEPVQERQQWRFRPTTDGYYRIDNRRRPQAIDVSYVRTDNSAPVIGWRPHGRENQQWRVEPLAGGGFQLRARHSGSCLDVTDMSTAPGALLQQWECTEGPAQRFELR